MAISIQLIRNSFEQIRSKSCAITERVEQLIAQAHPTIGDSVQKEVLASQRSAMVSSFVAIIANLDRPEPLTKYLLGLGERYFQLGVRGVHYDAVSQAILKAFSENLNGGWSSELEQEWTQVLGIITEALKAGGNTSPSNKTPEISPATTSGSSDFSLVLTEGAKLQIKKAVDETVQQLVSQEVRRYFEEHMRKIEGMKPEELLKRAV